MKREAQSLRGLKALAIITLSIISGQKVICAQDPVPAATPGVHAQASSSPIGGMQILTPTEGVNFGSYMEKMHADVKKKWSASLPSAYYMGAKGKAVIRFKVYRDGAIQDISLESSSGDDSLVQAALKGVRDSNPVDPLPPAFKGAFIELRAAFFYNQQPSNSETASSATGHPTAGSRVLLNSCDSPTSEISKQPPFDRLELFAFLADENHAQYETHSICQRGIDFVPDLSFLAALQSNGVSQDLVDALTDLKPRVAGQQWPDRASAYAFFEKALADKRNGRPTGANDDFERALKLAADSATLRLAYGKYLLVVQKLPEAEMQLRRSLELWPEDADAHAWLALGLLRQDRNQEAIPEARAALQIFPTHKLALTALGFGLARSGQYKEAIPVLQEAMPYANQLPTIHKQLGGSLLHMGDFDAAMEQLTLFLKTSPNDAEAHYFLGVALRGEGKRDEAAAQFQEAARIEPNNPLYSAIVDPDNSTKSATAGSKPVGPQPDDGFFSDNIYTNTFFAFSYEYPKGWVVQKADAGKKIVRIGASILANGDPTVRDIAEAIARNSHQLLLVTKQTAKDVSANFTLIQISALDQRVFGSNLKSGADFLKLIGPFLTQRGLTLSPAQEPEQIAIAGKTLWKLKMDPTINGVSSHTEEVVMIEKDYVLLFVFSTTDASLLDQLTGTMKSLRFTDSSH